MFVMADIGWILGIWSNSTAVYLGPVLRTSPSSLFVGRNICRKRTSNISAVGWPPVASFRKNITNSCMRKQQATAEQENLSPKEENNKNYANPSEHMFVKVYMDGYPISRKINLRAYDGYEKLSFTINELFQVLLADDVSFAKHDACGSKKEHTLVYEDIEGDRILVGDVPWNMFISTTKKLCVLKGTHLENGR